MNPKLLQSQFDRLSHNPGDVRLLKQLAVEFGSVVVQSGPEWLRHYRIAAATALRVVNEVKPESSEVAFARGVLSALLDAAACAEETLTAERVREGVRSVASRPLHRQLLRSLCERALTTKELTEQLNKQKSQVSGALHDLEEIGLIRAVERLPQANQKEKPYRLTLNGVTILDELPEDENPTMPDQPSTEDWSEFLKRIQAVESSGFSSSPSPPDPKPLDWRAAYDNTVQNEPNSTRYNASNRRRGTLDPQRGYGMNEARQTIQNNRLRVSYSVG